MPYRIRLGIPEISDFYGELAHGAQNGTLGKDAARLFKQITKVLTFLSSNPRHNSLNSHEIDSLSERYSRGTGKKIKVWQSYLENNTPAAGRLFWVYGPGHGELTIIGVEPHPEDRKKSGYSKVNLSDLPPV
jgi:hypothetical protein